MATFAKDTNISSTILVLLITIMSWKVTQTSVEVFKRNRRAYMTIQMKDIEHKNEVLRGFLIH